MAKCGIKDKQILAALIYHNIRVLMEESNTETFTEMLTRTLEQLADSPETEGFGKYFSAHYAKRVEEWASCYRKSAKINTNMYVESFHRTLKYIYLKGRVNKRIDNLLHVLMKVSVGNHSEGGKNQLEITEIRKSRTPRRPVSYPSHSAS